MYVSQKHYHTLHTYVPIFKIVWDQNQVTTPHPSNFSHYYNFLTTDTFHYLQHQEYMQIFLKINYKESRKVLNSLKPRSNCIHHLL
jgi:hypothetical protein